MAKAEQIKALIKSHLTNESERFKTIALQVAADEAKRGHVVLAREIREIVDNKPDQKRVKVVSISHDLADLVVEGPRIEVWSSFVGRTDLKSKIDRIITEFHQSEKLMKHGMTNRRKILLTGPPGTGKTMSASILAERTKLPFYVVQIDRLVTKYLGETNAKLRQIFSMIRERPGIYLFDEFDAIGAQRTLDNEVGEMRRVLNALLKFIEEDESRSLIVAATNNLISLDNALFRRFDDIIHYENPVKDEIISLIKNRTHVFLGKFSLDVVAKHALGLSHAEITQACDDAIKDAILSDKSKVTQRKLVQMLSDRKVAYQTV
ncbi:MAG: ATP-binding protein [Mariprofundaceae bacterium]|nr:ATP-binding protein [Mariprofundaceae bacterium]